MRLPELWKKAKGSWAIRSLLIGAVASACDLATLIFLVQVVSIDPVPGAALGVAVGATVNFILNRRFAFKDSKGKLGPQLFKYTLTVGAEMSVHATVVFFLSDQWGVNYILAKLTADVLVFAVANLAVLRLFVFPKPKPRAPAHVG
ncbi:MAG: GtrA family protein [Deltaproteobacteria bacterium]